MTFEHRHQNKSCSACRDRVNERVKVAKVAKVAKLAKLAKIVRVKVFQVFQNIPGSQLLSDIQTFFYLFFYSPFSLSSENSKFILTLHFLYNSLVFNRFTLVCDRFTSHANKCSTDWSKKTYYHFHQ